MQRRAEEYTGSGKLRVHRKIGGKRVKSPLSTGGTDEAERVAIILFNVLSHKTSSKTPYVQLLAPVSVLLLCTCACESQECSTGGTCWHVPVSVGTRRKVQEFSDLTGAIAAIGACTGTITGAIMGAIMGAIIGTISGAAAASGAMAAPGRTSSQSHEGVPITDLTSS